MQKPIIENVGLIDEATKHSIFWLNKIKQQALVNNHVLCGMERLWHVKQKDSINLITIDLLTKLNNNVFVALPKGLRAESWGCYWQTVPSEQVGGRLFDASAKFFTKTAITRDKNYFQDEKWAVSPRGLQTEISGPKNTPFFILTMFWPRPGKVVQTKKVPFSQINISLLANFGL